MPNRQPTEVHQIHQIHPPTVFAPPLGKQQIARANAQEKRKRRSETHAPALLPLSLFLLKVGLRDLRGRRLSLRPPYSLLNFMPSCMPSLEPSRELRVEMVVLMEEATFVAAFRTVLSLSASRAS